MLMKLFNGFHNTHRNFIIKICFICAYFQKSKQIFNENMRNTIKLISPIFILSGHFISYMIIIINK